MLKNKEFMILTYKNNIKLRLYYTECIYYLVYTCQLQSQPKRDQ